VRLKSSRARHDVGVVESTCTIGSSSADLRALIRCAPIARSLRARRSILSEDIINGP
jgi:hypothetical protein